MRESNFLSMGIITANSKTTNAHKGNPPRIDSMPKRTKRTTRELTPAKAKETAKTKTKSTRRTVVEEREGPTRTASGRVVGRKRISGRLAEARRKGRFLLGVLVGLLLGLILAVITPLPIEAARVWWRSQFEETPNNRR